MKSLANILSLCLLLSACAPLSRHDSIIGDIGEVAGRVILCPLTICVSEVHFYEEWKQEEAQRRYWKWYDTLTPEQQAREDERKFIRGLAATQALGMALSNGPIFKPLPQMPMAPLIPYEAPARQAPIRCTTQQYGDMATTNCY